MPAYSSPFQDSSLFQPILVYYSLFQPVPAYSSLFQPIPAYIPIPNLQSPIRNLQFDMPNFAFYPQFGILSVTSLLMNQLMNESINDKGVHRTALATPGLLITM